MGPVSAAPGARRYDDFIVLLARQRSGTNALRSVLDTHADIFQVPEIFNNRPTPSWELEVEANYFNFVEKHLDGGVREALSLGDHEQLFVDFLEYLRCFTDKRFLCIDVKYNSTHHLDGAWHFITEEPALFGLIRDHGLRVLNLTRRNFLRYYLSEVKAHRTQRWDEFDVSVVGDRPWFKRQFADKPASPRDAAVPLDVGELLTTLELCRSENEVISTSFRDYDLYLEVEYEDLFEYIGAPISEAVLQRIVKWLGIPDAFAERRPQYKKQSDLPLSKSIENYRSVRRVLKNTPFEHCLEDEALYRRVQPTRPAGAVAGDPKTAEEAS